MDGVAYEPSRTALDRTVGHPLVPVTRPDDDYLVVTMRRARIRRHLPYIEIAIAILVVLVMLDHIRTLNGR